ncbi:contractile injection system protein, VgrG/Pvc8 family [Pseudoalteromonas sp. NZS71]|uniref:contractile injection system protein, VgrG/Pvc8 family n=1 Tax=Pseudoalteromonas sp. NZS71 TaxID=2792052 RepID=UPI001E3979CB|nr:contractile injection system protein, VgrG/Pvc8 family [Pseudoalteromonas sp. NZS71]
MTKSNFFLKVNDKDFNVTYLHGYEKINKGFSYSLTVESSVKINTGILLANASVIFVNKNKRYKEQCGLITSVTNMGVFNNLHRFKINIQDRLSTLKDTSNSKVFITVNVQDVLNYLAQKAGYSSGQIVFRTSSALPHLKQCVQAMESDWAFFNRLMSQHGLFYWIESESNTETLVISDSNLNSPYLSTGVLEVKANAGMNAQYWGNFVGFMHSEVTQTLYNNAAQSNAHGQFQKVASNSQSFFEPAANSSAEASAQTQSFSNALATHNKLVTLTGNVSDVFAGCSISLDDNMGFASGDLLCIAIEHTLNQANDESSHEGEAHYHCVAQFIERGTPYKAMPEPHTPKPMVFPATVESLTSNAFVDEHGQYRIRTEFDKTARPVIQSSPALKKLALYACENQPQATGWHFPLVGGSEVLIGCINNDPNNTFIMGFALNADQPSVVTAANPTHNRLLSAAQNELMFDDDKDVPKVILQTLASEHYIELNAIKSGRQFIQWISQLGTINLHAGRDLCLETEQNNVQFVIKNNQFIDVKNTVSQTTTNSHVNYQSGGSQAFSGKNATLTSENEISLLTGRALKVNAQSDIHLKTNNSDLKLNVPTGSTFLQTNNNINITGSGNGDLIIHNAGGEIKLDSQGNVDITATNVLTLDGTFITFDGPVDYNITSPQTARAPSNASPASISQVTALDLSDNTLSASTLAQLELEYLYDDGSPVDGIDYIVVDNDGIEHTGSLANGVATLANLPQGKSDVLLRATTQADEQQLIQLRNDFKQHLTSMLNEIRKQAAIGDAIFEQEDFFTQWMIETGARATGLYQGAKSLVTGIADLIVLGIDVNISVYSACFRMIDAVASGDKHAVKHELETILAFSQKKTSALSDAFELLLALMDDEDTRNTLARFPYDYIEAHSYVDKQRITGVMAFEILLAILTGGVGVAASAASKSKHLASANRALVNMADILKRKQLDKTISHTVSPEQPKLIERIDKPDAALQPGTNRGVTTQVSALKLVRNPALDAHYKNLADYETAYKKKLAKAINDKDSSSRIGAFKAKLTEVKGERAASAYMAKHFSKPPPPAKMELGFGPGPGFDQVWAKRDKDGNVLEYFIVEAKGPGAKLTKGAKKGDQMTDKWIDNTLASMKKSKKYQAQNQLGENLFDAIEDGDPKISKLVIEAVEDNGKIIGGKLQPLP